MSEVAAVQELDHCQVCEGKSGGVLGNENRLLGLVMCDYCSCKASSGAVLPSPEAPKDFTAARLHNSFEWSMSKCEVPDCHWCKLHNSDVPPNI